MAIKLKPWVVALLAVSIAGCAVTPEYQRPQLDLPAQWDGPAAEAGAQVDWWGGFGSAELEELLGRALEGNRDLAAALSRIEQARASAKVVGAALRPQAGGGGSAGRNFRDFPGGVYTSSDQLQIQASYELDLWGVNRARREAALANLEARQFDHAALALALQAEVASAYFGALAQQDRLVIARQNLVAAREVLALVERRYEEGVTGGLELAQQRAAVANLEAQLPALAQQFSNSRTALAVLLGQPPQQFALAGDSLDGIRLPSIDAGQPTALLERRPDIRSAEAALLAASADIGVARAAFFPTARLTASAGISGLITGGATTIAALAASAATPIFEGGRLQGGLELSQARQEELVQRYGQAVLTALREVEDALTAVAASEARSEALQRAVAESREAYRLASVRYEAGSVDLLTLLDAQRSRLQAEDGLVQAQLAQYSAAVTLFRVLGGSWEEGA